MQGAWSGCFQGYGGEAMQDLGYELPRIPIPRTPVNKGMNKAHSPLGCYLYAAPPLSACFLLVSEELHPLRMQTCEEALRDGRIEFISRTQADEHLLAVGGQHVFAVGYHPVQAASASYYVFERWLVDGRRYVVALSGREHVCRKFALRPVE